MTPAEVLGSVRKYVTENYLYMRPGFDLGDEDSLFEAGIIDSMGVMELIVFLEEGLGLAVQDEEITEDNLGSLAAIAGYVIRKRSNGGKGEHGRP